VRVAVALAVLLLGGCAASQPPLQDERFVSVNQASFTPHELQRVRVQLDAGATALARYLGPIPSAKYDRPAEVVIDDWLKFVTDLPGDTTTARSDFRSMQGRR
jgi:hypothetical protein